MIEDQLSRAQLLINQKRYREADKILTELLSLDPNNIHILASLSEVALEMDNAEKAQNLIDNAISQAPDSDYLYCIKARVMLSLKQYDTAEECLLNATTINPNEGHYFAIWAHIKLARKKYQEAVDLANKSLELDSDNILGLNTRSTALLKLDDKEGAFNTIENALKEDPNNAYTHANYGWGLLEKGDHKKALVHFGEALKNDPNFAFAQAGMLEALKAKYVIYRWFLKYAFFMGNLTAKYQWGVIIGIYVAFRALGALSRNVPVLEPYLTPILILLGLFAFSTWVMTPLSNLFLRLNKYGKHLLSKKEKLSSNFVGLSALVFLLGVAGIFLLGDFRWLIVAIFGFVMMVPFSVMFSPSSYKHALIIYAAAMFVVGSAAIFHTFTSGELFGTMSYAFFIGFIAFQWLSNYLLIREDNV